MNNKTGNDAEKNLLGISDSAQLKRAEYEITRLRLAELLVEPAQGDFDLRHLKAIHKHLFSDVYVWAGQVRDPEHEQQGSDRQGWPSWKENFARPHDIEKMAEEAHALLKEKNNLRGLETRDFARAVVPIYAKFHQIQPFPMGNERATQAMFAQLAHRAGHEIDFSQVTPAVWRDAAARSVDSGGTSAIAARVPADLSAMRVVFEKITDPERIRNGVVLEPIRRTHYDDPDTAKVQEDVIRAVLAKPQHFIDKYIQDDRAFAGRYVAADLFKEVFDQYSESKESRNLMNRAVHNSAAVLSAALFRQVLADKSHPERDTVVFLTGIPGAGKTSTVVAAGELDPRHKMIFEGQMSDPVSSIAKIQMVLDAGLKPSILVVHALPENALDNTLKRYGELGRGAGVEVMAKIQGGLPVGLKAVHEQFGEKVVLQVADVRDRANVQVNSGWKNLNLLKSEGNYEQIKQRLVDALDKKRRAGLDENAYRQAAGIYGKNIEADLAGKSGRIAHTDVGRRSVQTESRQEPVLKSKDMER